MSPILKEEPASMNINALEYQQRNDVVIVIQSSKTSTQHEDVVSLGDEALPMWPVEGAKDGENNES